MHRSASDGNNDSEIQRHKDPLHPDTSSAVFFLGLTKYACATHSAHASCTGWLYTYHLVQFGLLFSCRTTQPQYGHLCLPGSVQWCTMVTTLYMYQERLTAPQAAQSLYGRRPGPGEHAAIAHSQPARLRRARFIGAS